MRQIGTDFNFDPYQPIVPLGLPYGETPADHSSWAKNTVTSKQHQFCANLCIDFKNGNKISEVEQKCMQSCFTKYTMALNTYLNEKKLFAHNLDDLVAKGQDRYNARE